jgi:hypothetical protein
MRMKIKFVKILLTIVFFLVELGLPVFIYGTYFFAKRAHSEYRLNKFDINKDGIWTDDEQVGDYQRWADAVYSGDGARFVFFVYICLTGPIFGIIYKVVFFLGDKLKNHIYKKLPSEKSLP